MSDQRIRHLFDQLVAEPSAEFEASLRARLMTELTTSERSRPDAHPQHDQLQEDLIVTVTLDRRDAPAPPERPRRRLVIALSAAAAIVVLAGAALLVTRDTEPDTVVPATAPSDGTEAPAITTPAEVPATATPATSPPATSPPVDPITAERVVVSVQAPVAAPATFVARSTFTDSRIDQIKFDGLNLWAVGEESTDLFRIDTTTGKIVEELTLPSTTTPLAWLQAHDGLLYVTTADGVVIVNGATKAISEPRAAGSGGVESMAFVGDVVWLVRSTYDETTKTGTTSLEQWDRALLTITRSVEIGALAPSGIVAAGDSLFLATGDSGLLRFDHDGTLTATIDGVGAGYILGATGDSVWVPDWDRGEVVRIDVATNEILARIPVGDAAHNIVATGTSVWVTTYTARNINVIDPSTNALTARTLAAPRPTSLALIDGVVWVAGGGQVNSFVPTPA